MTRFLIFLSGFLFFLTLLAPTAVQAQKYTGIWRSDIRKDRILIGARWERFDAERAKLAKKNFHIIDIETELRDGVRYYTGVWHAGGKAPKLWLELSPDQLNDKLITFKDADGFGLIDLEVYQRNGQQVYMGIWRDVAQDQEVVLNVNYDRFRERNTELREDGFQLMDFEISLNGDEKRYTAFWQKTGADYRFWHSVDWACFRTIREGLHEIGFRLIDIEIYTIDGQRKFSAVWHRGGGADRLWILESGDIFVQKWKEFELDNYRLIDLDVNDNQ